MFKYRRQVHFYETDLMKIVHHANYLKFAEETRVAWALHNKVLDPHNADEAARLAVVSTAVSHISPLRFADLFEVEMQGKRQGIRIVFEYKIWNLLLKSGKNPTTPNVAKLLAAEVRSVHVAINPDARPEKPTPELKSVMEKEAWTETWLSNL
jgi:acyl-CoA thioester hydrolase